MPPKRLPPRKKLFALLADREKPWPKHGKHSIITSCRALESHDHSSFLRHSDNFDCTFLSGAKCPLIPPPFVTWFWSNSWPRGSVHAICSRRSQISAANWNYP